MMFLKDVLGERPQAFYFCNRSTINFYSIYFTVLFLSLRRFLAIDDIIDFS